MGVQVIQVTSSLLWGGGGGGGGSGNFSLHLLGHQAQVVLEELMAVAVAVVTLMFQVPESGAKGALEPGVEVRESYPL